MRSPLSSSNQNVQLLRRLCRDRAARAAEAAVVVEGRVLATELLAGLAAGAISAAVRSIYADPADAGAVQLAEAAVELGATWYPVASDVLDRVADAVSSQGVVLVCDRPAWTASHLGASGLVLALDAVSDPGNVGTVLRTAAAVGAAGVVVARGADPFAPKVVRAARGAQLSMAVVEVDDLAASLAGGIASGRQVAVAAAEGEAMWTEALPEDLVLVVGNEADGVSDAVAVAADRRLAIAMPGGTESLNAGVAASVLAYEWLRCRRQP